VTASGEHQPAPVVDLAESRDDDGDTANSTFRAQTTWQLVTHPHICKRGDINPRFCRVCSKPMP